MDDYNDDGIALLQCNSTHSCLGSDPNVSSLFITLPLLFPLLVTLLVLHFRPRADTSLSPPEVPGVPMLGNILQMDTDCPQYTLSTWAQQYGPCYMIKVFTEKILVLNDCEYIRKALIEQVRMKITSS